MYPKVLIVGTVPYNNRSTSRAFDSYFHNWEKENLAQIFSNTKKPCKGHCGTLYQITDQRMVQRFFNRRIHTGVVYNYGDLEDEWTSNSLEVNNSAIARLYAWGSRKSPIVYLVRKFLWKKKYWCTDELNAWMEKFAPDCVFLSFSDDFFIPQIALYAAERYNIPIVSSIGDDYYFNYHLSLSPYYHWYKLAYRKLIRRVFRHLGSAIYIGDKIRDKYNSEFGLNGKTVYLTSSVERHPFREIDRTNPKISYFGNIRLGRNESLNDVGRAIGQINPAYMLDIYSNETDPKYFRLFEKNPNVWFHGSISYREVQEKTAESDIVVVVEGFKKKDVGITRYSLSTKMADALASGANVLAYGSSECGVIEYAQSIGCVAVCTNPDDLKACLERLIADRDYQRGNYKKAIEITQAHHNLEQSTRIFENVVKDAIKGNGGL